MKSRAAFKSLPVSESSRRVRELFDYEPASGRLIRRKRSTTAPAGYVVPWVSLGYGFVSVDGIYLQIHRVIWLHQYGRWPDGVIDHIDGDTMNNRLGNLRDVSHTVNCQNQRRARSDNRTSGLLGVRQRKDTGRFAARIRVGGQTVSLGCFDTAEEAHAAYIAAKRRLHEGCTL